MERVEDVTQRLWAAKEARRRSLMDLPLKEKVRVLVEIQKMAYPIEQGRNPRACIWDISSEYEETKPLP